MTRPEPETPLADTFDELPEPAPNTALAGVDPGPAHGAYRPGLVSQMGLLIGRALPAGRTGLRLSGLARPLAVSGLKDGKADVKALGLKLRLHPEDNLSEKRAFLTPQCFDAAELSELRAAMGPGKTFIDIGAGAGLHALVAAKAGGPAARVIAVEPRSALRRRLAYNARANGLENVEISGAALSDYEGESVMRLVHGEGEAVRVTRLSTLLDEMKVARLDVMKIDTAGAEASILAPWFAETPRERWPGLIIMERSAGQSAENARDALFLACQRGYTVERETRSNAIVRLDVS
ncbi:FkbM family methyltransferase [Glycocaulis sp.]